MLNTAEAIESVFLSTPLVEKRFQALPVPDTDEQVFCTELAPDKLLEAWRVARAKVDKTGRWPVVVEPWGDIEDYLDRYEYGSEKLGALKAAQIQAQAQETDLAACFRAWEERDREPASDWLETELDYTRVTYGCAPEAKELESCTTQMELDRALMDWEIAQGFGDDPALPRHIEWFTPHKPHLFLLPTPHSWATLSYMVWYEQKTLAYTALLKSWQERYGAELVCHYSTMLQFQVASPPRTLEEARKLAIEHLRVAPCTLHLPGVTLREHARALQGNTTWFLHERP